MNEPKPSKFSFGARLMVGVAVIGLMAAIIIPNVREARATAAKNACVANLKQISGLQRSWSLENKKGLDDLVDIKTASMYLKDGVMPTCPAGGSYQVLRVKDKPTCTLAHTLGHSL
ncbi:MAG: hypothetical protein K0Q55_2606 [Verrucomicrobia bacterium]|jgi:type II secretory pathway pseudopilin PulG|nr:hypothetical protein [Verrucomicrobiota bacterium]